MADKHRQMSSRPSALTIEALSRGGYVVKSEPDDMYRRQSGPNLVAAFTRLSDAVSWIEEQMRLDKLEDGQDSWV